jgi:YfiR/HmsC-like
MRQSSMTTPFRACFAIALGLSACGVAEAQAIDEYQVKAAFLYNFAKFVEWPQQTFKSPHDPMSICVLGASPVGKTLDETISGKSIDGRIFTVRQITDVGQSAGCQILFVSTKHKKSLIEAVTAGILTVGESKGFSADGGMIEFKLEGGRVRLEINAMAAEKSKLRISSKLLSLAGIVRTNGI